MIFEYGGNVLEKISVDAIYNEIDLEREYIDLKSQFHFNVRSQKSYEKYYKSDKCIDDIKLLDDDNYFETYDEEMFDDFNFYASDNSFLEYEPIIIRKLKGYYYFILHPDYDIYLCDMCEKYRFYDFKKQYALLKEFYDNEMKADLCPKCIKIKRQNALKKARQKLYDEDKIPTSKQQKYLANLFNGKLNYPIEGFHADILIENNIIVEYDGSGHYLSAMLSPDVTKKDIMIKDLKRDKITQKKGYKVIRIESKNDYLPSDYELNKIINNAKETFENGKLFYRISVDDAYNKNELRQIKDTDLEEVV